MTFYFDSFSLHTHLIKEGFESVVSEGEFYLEINESDDKLIQFYKLVKFNTSDFTFIYNTLETINDEKKYEELLILFEDT